MRGFAAILILVLEAASLPTVDSGVGTIEGYVADENGNPICGATVLLLDTEYGAMTDMNGAYIILSVPEGEYSVRARMMGLQEETLRAVVHSDLTTSVKFRLEPAPTAGAPWRPELAESMKSVPPETLLVRGADGRPLENLTVTCRRWDCLVEQLSDSVFLFTYDNDADHVFLRLPWSRMHILQVGGEYQTCVLDLSEGTSDSHYENSPAHQDLDSLPLMAADIGLDEWTAPGIASETEIIDPLEFGFSDYAEAGLQAAGTAHRTTPDGEEWVVCLVYYDRVVTVVQEDQPLVTEIPTPTNWSNAFFSPGCRQVLIRSGWHPGGCRAWDVLVVDTSSGSIRSLEHIPSESAGRSGAIIEVEPASHHMLADDGSHVFVHEDTLRIFSESGNLVFGDIFEIRDFFHDDAAIRSADGSLVGLMDTAGESGPDLYRLFVLTQGGEMLYSKQMGWGTMAFSYDGSVLAFATEESIVLLDGRSGVRIGGITEGFPASHIPLTPVLSPNGSYLAYWLRSAETQDRATFVHDLSGESEVRVFRRTKEWDFVTPAAVSDSGWVVMRLYRQEYDVPECSAALRYVLLDETGGLVWMSPERYLGQRSPERFDLPQPWDMVSISRDGHEVIYADGDFFYVVRFTETTD